MLGLVQYKDNLQYNSEDMIYPNITILLVYHSLPPTSLFTSLSFPPPPLFLFPSPPLSLFPFPLFPSLFWGEASPPPPPPLDEILASCTEFLFALVAV